MTQSDHAEFLALQERVKRLEMRLDVLDVRLQEEVFGSEIPMEAQPDHAAERAARAEQFGRGSGKRIAS